MLEPLLYIVVLNNNRADALACLASLFQSDYSNFRVILLDYGPVDNSLDEIRAKFAEVEIILLRDNLGYAGNNNVGIKRALEQGAEWVFLLNDDTVLDPSCLSSLLKVLVANPAIGIAGPMVYHFDEPDIIQSAGGVLGKYWDNRHLGQNQKDMGQFASAHSVEWISGCAILIRRRVIEQVGVLDADYFLYWEETEWCIRAARAGWEIVHIPDARLWHKGVSRDYQPKPYVTYYLTRNHLITLAKHRAPFKAWIFILAKIFRTLTSWTLKPRWRSKREHRNAMWRGLMDFINHRRGPMSSRSSL